MDARSVDGYLQMQTPPRHVSEAFEEHPLLESRSGAMRSLLVGKAVPAGARKGNAGVNIDPVPAMSQRQRKHAESVRQVEEFAAGAGPKIQLKLDELFFRYLLVDDIWMPLGESILIEQFNPAWNVVIDGFGNHDPGKGRHNQRRSPWDTLYPGRHWAIKCKPYSKTWDEILDALKAFFATRA